EHGVTSMNYYMFFGGTNFGDHAAMGIATTYDYNAPIREAGGVGERWRAVAAIGQMLKEHGARLARAEMVPLHAVQKSHEDVSVVMRRAADGSRYVFVRTEQRARPRQGQAMILATGDSKEID